VAPGRLAADRPSGAGPARPDAPLLRITELSKSFAGTPALDRVSLDVHAGEVVAVVGQNGSGKSTLVKVLAGVHPPDPGGTIEVCDAHGALVPSGGAANQTLHFIHQDLGLLPMMSTTENLDLSHPIGLRSLLPRRRADEHRRAGALVGQFGVAIDVRAPVATLSPAEKAIVAITRALDGWSRPEGILVLDEPTAAFHRDEVLRLFQAVRQVAEQGAGVIFISHRLDEVDALADRVVVLRDGRKVVDVAAGQLDDDELIRAIVGADLVEARRRPPKSPPPEGRPPVLQLTGITGRRVRGLHLEVGPGEIVGVAGVVGSGREELGSLVFGAERRRGGQVLLDGVDLAPGDLASAIGRGAAFVPGDRQNQGAVGLMSMRENLTLPSLAGLRRRFGWLDRGAERQESREWALSVGLRPPQPERPLMQFSGGNQQKVILAKWLRTRPRLLILDEPTAGVDVGAKATIYELLMDAASGGTAVLVCSSDTKELATLCDRVIVLDDGRAVGEYDGAELDEEALVRATQRATRDEPARRDATGRTEER
jgi:ABC-type sugar transport system ATPase subunit